MKLQNLNKKLLAGALLAMTALSASAAELSVQSPTRAASKADLIVFAVAQKAGTSDTFGVTLKNIGNVRSESGILSAQNTAPAGGYGEATIPAIDPGQATIRDVKLSKAPNKGNQIKFVADAKNHIDESNEGNNIKYFSY